MENDFRKKMKKIIDENLDEFESGGNGKEDAETARKLFEQFRGNLPAEENAKPRPKKKFPLFIPVAAAVLVGIFIGSFLFSDVPAARAFKTNVEQFFTSIFSPDTKIEEDGQQIDEYQSVEDLQKDLDFTLPQFTWIPEGYELSSVQKGESPDESKIISEEYLNPTMNPLGYISISIVYMDNSSETQISGLWFTREYISEEINNIPVTISSDKPYSSIFFYRDMYQISITTNDNIDTLKNIIANIQ